MDELSQDEQQLRSSGADSNVLERRRVVEKLRLKTDIRHLTRGEEDSAPEAKSDLHAAIRRMDEVARKKWGS